MNKLLVLFLLISINAFSQFKLLDEKLEEKTFRLLNRPSTENKLSEFLKEHLDPQEIIALNYSTPPNLQNSIRAQFEVNKYNKPWNFRLYTGRRELNKKLEALLKEFLIKEIPNLSDLYQARSKIQLISRIDNGNIINASTVIVCDYPPLLNNCKESAYGDIYGCFKKDIENFIINNINYNVLKREGVIGKLEFGIDFKIDKKGKMFDITCFLNDYLKPTYSKHATILNSLSNEDKTKHIGNLENEILRILKLYESNILAPANRNGVPFESSVSRRITLYIDEYLNQNEISNLEKNSFTKFFRKELSFQDINLADFTPGKPINKVFFTFNSKGDLFKIWTNATSPKLNQRIIKTLKKYPIDSLKLDKSIDKRYSLGIIRNISNKKQILCDEVPEWVSVGYFKTCPNCKNLTDLNQFNFSQIQDYILKEFNSTNNVFKLMKKKEIDKTLKQPHIKLNLFVSKEGQIIKSGHESLSKSDFKMIFNQIDSIIEKMPKYVKMPAKNDKFISMGIGSLIFKIVKK